MKKVKTKVKEIMRVHFVSATPEASFARIWEVLKTNHIHGLPIVNRRKKLVGIITEADLLRKLYPSYTEYIEDFRQASVPKIIEEKIGSLKKLQAKDIMNRKVHLAYPNDLIVRALSKMILRQVGQLPVIDYEENLLGVISKGDIFDHLFLEYLRFPRLKKKRVPKKAKSS